jgi:hypothetical protein
VNLQEKDKQFVQTLPQLKQRDALQALQMLRAFQAGDKEGFVKLRSEAIRLRQQAQQDQASTTT